MCKHFLQFWQYDDIMNQERYVSEKVVSIASLVALETEGEVKCSALWDAVSHAGRSGCTLHFFGRCCMLCLWSSIQTENVHTMHTIHTAY